MFAIGMSSAFFSEVLHNERQAVAAPLRVSVSRSGLAELVARSTAVAEIDGVEQQIAELWAVAQRARNAAAESSGAALHVVTRRTLAYVIDAPELSRSELARIARTCPGELSRHFHSDVGMTLVQYRTRTRLLRFIQLVDGKAANLTAAALDAGFGSYSQCHRSFYATFGCTPRLFFQTDLRQQMEEAFEPVSGD
jgi:AraC-like DNA-binding protein